MIWTFEVYNYAFWSHECVIWVLVYGKCPFPSLNIFMIVCWMTSCSLKTLVQQVFHVSNPFESQSLVDGCRGSISLRITIDLLLSKGFMPFSNWWIESLRWHISAHAQRLSTKRKNRSGYMRSSLTFRFFRLHY